MLEKQTENLNFGDQILNLGSKYDFLFMIKFALLLLNASIKRSGCFLIAVKADNLNSVLFLIDKGADVNENTPIIYAVLNNNSQIVRALLKAGANPNFKSQNQDETIDSTPLILAVEHNFNELIELLIKNRADPNITNIFGSALHNSIAFKNKDAAILLLENGADPYIRNEMANKNVIELLNEVKNSEFYQFVQPYLIKHEERASLKANISLRNIQKNNLKTESKTNDKNNDKNFKNLNNQNDKTEKSR